MQRDAIPVVLRRSLSAYIFRWREQKAVQQWQKAVQQLQRFYRARQSRRSFLRLRSVVLQTQAWARAYRVRKRSSKAVKRMCKKIAAARARATPANLLGNLSKKALQQLMNGQKCAQLSSSLHILETTTRLSAACCTMFAKMKTKDRRGRTVTAAAVLYTFMNDLNKSKPHMDQLRTALKVLLNVSRYPKLVPAVALVQVDWSAELLNHMQRTRKSNPEVFVFAVRLLARLLSVPAHDDVTRGVRNNAKAMKSLNFMAKQLGANGVTGKPSARGKDRQQRARNAKRAFTGSNRSNVQRKVGADRKKVAAQKAAAVAMAKLMTTLRSAGGPEL